MGHLEATNNGGLAYNGELVQSNHNNWLGQCLCRFNSKKEIKIVRWSARKYIPVENNSKASKTMIWCWWHNKFRAKNQLLVGCNPTVKMNIRNPRCSNCGQWCRQWWRNCGRGCAMCLAYMKITPWTKTTTIRFGEIRLFCHAKMDTIQIISNYVNTDKNILNNF
jgi:hypothetical protein